MSQTHPFHKKKRLKLSIIIPVYNEQSTVASVVDQVCTVELPGFDKEIIIADDGSRDDTPNVIAKLAKKYTHHSDIIKVHTSLINLGKGAAIRFGLEFATGDLILIQDADLELHPSTYPELLEPILRGEADIVYGSRFRERSNCIPVKTRMANWFLTRLTNLLYGARLTDMATGFKVFPSEVIKGLTLRSVRFEFEPEVTAKVLLSGCKIIEVPIPYKPRTVLEGKKIGWLDGLEYIFTLIRYRFF